MRYWQLAMASRTLTTVPMALILGAAVTPFRSTAEVSAITEIVPVDASSVVTWFSNGAVYYSPNNRSVGGGGSTVSAYNGSIAMARIVKVGSGLLTEFQNGAVYLSPNGQNLGGGAATISVANWIHAPNGPFPKRDSAKGAVYNNRLFLSGGVYNVDQTGTYSYFDLWNTSNDESGTTWNNSPVKDCYGDLPQAVVLNPPDFSCWDAFGPLVVWNSTLWALGSSVWSSTDGTSWTRRATPGGNATPTTVGEDENTPGGVVLGSYMYYMHLDGTTTDVQRTNSSTGTPWSDMGQIQTGSSPPVVMEPRCGTAVFVLGGKLWIEGGRDAVPNCDSNTDYTNDIWSTSDGITWTRASTTPAWGPRQWPCVTTDSSGTVWLVGGYMADFVTGIPNEIRYETNFADVWYTKDGITWKQFKAGVGSELPDDLSLGLEPRHAPICYIDGLNNRLVVVAGKVTRQPTPKPPYPLNPVPVPKHDSGNFSNDVRIVQLPDPSTLP